MRRRGRACVCGDRCQRGSVLVFPVRVAPRDTAVSAGSFPAQRAGARLCTKPCSHRVLFMDTEACTWPESLIPLILPQPKPCVGGRGDGASSPSVWACEEGTEPWAGGSPSCGRCPVRSSSGAEGRSSPCSPSSCRSCGVLRCPETGRSLPPAAPGRGRGLRRSAPPGWPVRTGRLPPSALRNREVCVLPWSFPWA